MKEVVTVKMLVNTAFGGKRLHVGDELNVAKDVGERWAKRKVAQLASTPTPPGDANIEELTAKQLYALCVEKGLDVQPKMKKEDYLNLLSQEG